MTHYRAKPLGKKKITAVLQYRTWIFFWRTIASGKLTTMQAHARDLEHRRHRRTSTNPGRT